MFAVNDRCERRIFNSRFSAADHLSLTKSALSFGPLFVTVRQVLPERLEEFVKVTDRRY